MASISGVSGNNTISSLYNSANTISGLASGLDTEGMIENLVKSYQTKINSLNQNVTKTEWKQEAYRSIISKLVGFNQKYTSYTSATNLMSPNFFNSAVKIATKGLYADKVTASGKTGSDIALNAVHQLATAAQYRVGDSQLNGGVNTNSAIQGTELDLLGQTELGTLQGSLTITYGTNKLNVNFDQVSDVKAMDEIRAKLAKEQKISEDKVDNTEVLAGLIEQKLAGQKITFSNGQSEDAADRISVTVKDGAITFADKSNAKNAVYMSQASGNVESVLGLDLDNASENHPATISGLNNSAFNLTQKVDNIDYLSGKALNLNLNGTTKTVYAPTVKKIAGTDGNPDKYTIDGTEVDKADLATKYAEALNKSVGGAFRNKIEVTAVDAGTDGKFKLNFNVLEEGSDLLINSDVGETLGIGRTATTYLNTSNTLEKLLGDKLKNLEVAKDKDGKDLLDDKGNKMYAFKINDVTIGNYSKETKLSDILSDINSNKEAGVKVSYSQTTKEFLFSAKETGEDSGISMDSDLAKMMFGDTQNAVTKTSKIGDIVGNGLNDVFKLNVGGEEVTINAPWIDYDNNVTGWDNTSVGDLVGHLNKKFSEKYGVEFSFDTQNNSITAVDKDGNNVKVEATSDFSKKLFGTMAEKSSYTAGQDAKFTATINGRQMEMTRSSNSVSIDGLTVNMKETFNSKDNGDGSFSVENTKDSVTFESSTDSDKIVDAVKSMIEDYNAMLGEIRTAYSTLPAQKTDGSSYEPLTSDEASKYSASEQERYEEKAKQGLLFADRDLSSLYNKLQNVFSPAGEDGAILRGMGISTSYDVSTGSLNITLDEGKLRAMLDSDPDMVSDAFTKTSGLGGVMQNVKTTLDTYAKTTGEPKGILIQKAGSPLSPLSLMNNTWQKQIDNINKQIEKWQDKLSSQVDRYTQQFSRLEQLINQMNSQSSALAGLMGG